MSGNVLLQLGSFQFGISTAAHQELTQSREWRWAAVERVNRSPARQFMGEGEQAITLTGVILPHFRGGLGQVDRLAELAGKGKPLLLVDGQGHDLGFWCITQIQNSHKELAGGGLPLRIDFTITLAWYGEDAKL